MAFADSGVALFIAVGLDRNGKKRNCLKKVRKWKRTNSGSEGLLLMCYWPISAAPANPGSLKERIRKRVRGSGSRSLPTGGLVTSAASWYSGRGHPNLCFPFLLPSLGIIRHHCLHWCLSKFLLREKFWTFL